MVSLEGKTCHKCGSRASVYAIGLFWCSMCWYEYSLTVDDDKFFRGDPNGRDERERENFLGKEHKQAV